MPMRHRVAGPRVLHVTPRHRRQHDVSQRHQCYVDVTPRQQVRGGGEERQMTMLTAEDRWAIGETLSKVGLMFDAGELDRLEEAFTPDAVYDLTDAGLGVLTGVEAMRHGARQLGAGNPVAHHLTNVVITGEGDDEVSVQSKGLLLMTDGTLTSITQHDIVRRHDGGWRISRHTVKGQRSPMSGKYPAAASPLPH
jgi:hypothetical protein